MDNGSNNAESNALSDVSRLLTETFTITAVRGGSPGAYGCDLTSLPNTHHALDHDLHWRLGLLFPLREWLDAHGVFTPGSGVWVHALPHDEHPEDVSEDGPIDGTVLGTCLVTTTMDARKGGDPARFRQVPAQGPSPDQM